MFWKFHIDSSAIDTLLTKQDVTLKEILSEDDVLQECKSPNKKLLDFLTKDEVLKELLNLVISEPLNEVEEIYKYKYMNLACEVLTLDIYSILNKIASSVEYLNILWGYISSLPPLNPLSASFFSKVLTILICRKTSEVIAFLKSNDAVNKLLVHIEISAIMELFIKLVTGVDSHEIRLEVSRWLDEEKLIEKLTNLLHSKQNEDVHYNAGQLLSELLRIGRDSMSQFEFDEDPLLRTLEKKETVEHLLNVMFNDLHGLYADSSMVNGITFLGSLIEVKRPEEPTDGMEDIIHPIDHERLTISIKAALEVLSNRIPDFHQLLVQPNDSSMETTFGTLKPPLGKVRLSIAALISRAVATNNYLINDAIAKAGTVKILLDLFSFYEWNNFLHTHVLQCIAAILYSECLVNESEERKENKLLKNLFEECKIFERCIELWENNEISQKSGGSRKGYMGHLTKMINEITKAKEKGPNQDLIMSMFNELSDETRESWNSLVTGQLADLNKKNMCSAMGNMIIGLDTDSDSDENKHNFSRYEAEGSLQQAYENYQVQPMTNEFMETFGYDEIAVHDSQDLKSPFSSVGNNAFIIKADEESENEKLFESICIQKIQPFDDNSSDEEEDIWEEKQISFSTPHIRNRKLKETLSDSDSSDEETSKEQEEKMDVDAEWSANFDNMDVQENPWSSPSNQDLFRKYDIEEDFADFTNIASFELKKNSTDEIEMEINKQDFQPTQDVKVEETKKSIPTTNQEIYIESTVIKTQMVGGYVVVDQINPEPKSESNDIVCDSTKVDEPVSSITPLKLEDTPGSVIENVETVVKSEHLDSEPICENTKAETSVESCLPAVLNGPSEEILTESLKT
ncbi:serine/threonine-protein phosphatase 6 regulatory subunit 3 isoform X2 [Hydra vulgaris]|uniref:Serine/threonine-protein phosphatase 6 regulatory subunit 3 isoform X2 n=1 Tax=Hydra vulgaris TaxID=6087 RepID=A0ABM4D2Y8_HYDVU